MYEHQAGEAARVAAAPTKGDSLPLLYEADAMPELQPVMVAIMSDLGFDSFMYSHVARHRPAAADGAPRMDHAAALMGAPLRRARVHRDLQFVPTETYNRNLPLVWTPAMTATTPPARRSSATRRVMGVCRCVAIVRYPQRRASVRVHGRSARWIPRRCQAVSERLGQSAGSDVVPRSSHGALSTARRPARAVVTGVSVNASSWRWTTSLADRLKLDIKERTANYHFNNLIHKMGVLNRKVAIAVAHCRGWVRVGFIWLDAGRRSDGAATGCTPRVSREIPWCVLVNREIPARCPWSAARSARAGSSSTRANPQATRRPPAAVRWRARRRHARRARYRPSRRRLATRSAGCAWCRRSSSACRLGIQVPHQVVQHVRMRLRLGLRRRSAWPAQTATSAGGRRALSPSPTRCSALSHRQSKARAAQVDQQLAVPLRAMDLRLARRKWSRSAPTGLVRSTGVQVRRDMAQRIGEAETVT